MDQLYSILESVWGIERKDIVPIAGGYQNHVSEVLINGDFHILRISKDSTRSKAQILSELMWCSSLHQDNLSVVKPLERPNAEIVKSFLSENELYHAVLFEKVPGKKLTYGEYLNNEWIYQQIGKLTAQIHAHSLFFSQQHEVHRPYWYENAYIKEFKNIVPLEDVELHNAFDELISECHQLEININNFGLIHGDINVGNFHVYDNRVILFDFDECQWSWYVEDIAISLFYTIYVYGEDAKDERIQQGKTFLRHYLNEYKKIIPISEKELALIPLFLRLREFIVYVGVCKKWDLSNTNQWQTDYLKDTRLRLALGRSLMDIEDIFDCNIDQL